MGVFLRSLVGFLIQFGSGIALSLLPFDKEAFHNSYRRAIAKYCVMAAVLSFCFPIADKFLNSAVTSLASFNF